MVSRGVIYGRGVSLLSRGELPVQKRKLAQRRRNRVLSDGHAGEKEHVKLPEAKENVAYDRDGILDKLGDTGWPQDVPWVRRLSVDIDSRQEQEVDMNDDLPGELSFYTQVLEGTREAFGKLQSMGLPFLRPSDYRAEMVKTDSHMEKVKARLLAGKREEMRLF
ncbi:probable rRNA-processing protein EBP2 homolog [Eucalyptus grandis]|uniref:probable rRNA-processing protein EBP2 homolog n=1 Tax=Eucalyptus grandis TaxID=71139 RepID=UPI00192F1105|nr:probable rRNA-processing protein EBP2 homolog [Eucalyptus grandis]